MPFIVIISCIMWREAILHSSSWHRIGVTKKKTISSLLEHSGIRSWKKVKINVWRFLRIRLPWQQETVGTHTHTQRNKRWKTDSVELATFLLEGGKQEAAVWPQTEEISQRTMSSRWRRQRARHPKIAHGLVTNIWLGSTRVWLNPGGYLHGWTCHLLYISSNLNRVRSRRISNIYETHNAYIGLQKCELGAQLEFIDVYTDDGGNVNAYTRGLRFE